MKKTKKKEIQEDSESDEEVEVMKEDKSKYCFYVKTTTGSIIKSLTEVLKDIIDDINIHLTKDFMKIITMTNNKDSFIYLKLENNGNFQDYYCESPRIIGLSMVSFYKLLKSMNNSDVLTLFILKSDDNHLGIRIENKEKKKKFDKNLMLLDHNEDIIQIPSINYDISFNIPCSEFQNYCRDLSTISTELSLYTHNNSTVFSMRVEGDYADSECFINYDDNVPIDLDSSIHIGRYSLKDLILFSKASSLCNMMNIFIKEDSPLILVYSVANLGMLRFVISTKVNVLN